MLSHIRDNGTEWLVFTKFSRDGSGRENMATEAKVEVNNNRVSVLHNELQTKYVTLTYHSLWGNKVRPDLDVLKFDFD